MLKPLTPINIQQIVKRVLHKTEVVMDEIQSLDKLVPLGSVLIQQVKYLIVTLHQEILAEIEFPGNRDIPLMITIRLKFLTLYWMAHHHIFPSVLDQLAEVHGFLRNIYSNFEHGYSIVCDNDTNIMVRFVDDFRVRKG